MLTRSTIQTLDNTPRNNFFEFIENDLSKDLNE
jgi:hypothetical protein